MKNLLAIDIGNSHAKYGYFEGETLTDRWSCPLSEIKDCTARALTQYDSPIAIASVVPRASAELTEILVGREVISVRPEEQKMLTGVDQTMGADRLCDALAAWKIYGKGKKPVVIFGMGTATTMLVVSGEGHVLGGYIAPGLGLTLSSMHKETALLPLLEMTGQSNALGYDTESHMRNGVFVGHCGLVKEWLKAARRQGGKKIIRVATGGWSEAIAVAFPEGKVFDVVDRDLTLKGIRLLAKRIVKDRAGS